MLTQTGNILSEGQVVQLDLGGKTTALPCRVLGFGDSTVMLAPVAGTTGASITVESPKRSRPAAMRT